MNPSKGLGPRMITNEALRRLVFIFQDANGNPQPGAPGGPIMGKTVGPAIRHTLVTAAPAFQLVPADTTRVGSVLVNIGPNDPIYYGSSPNTTDVTGGGDLGGTLLPGQSVVLNTISALYVYAATGTPIAEITSVTNT